ncbi:MAG TPA: hypothetical protein VGQ31_10445 [Candidatus Limnocylindrales bacterium]|nr:hypothetical protein [Candidatus Limnocylindrales bacterium]
MSGPAARLIEAALAAGAGDETPVHGRTVAVGWATVETERAIESLASDLHISPAAFLFAPDSEALGARCVVARGVLPGGGALVVLEAATEGLLAATLARHDEGPRVVWLAPDGPATIVATRPSLGPFGPERLLPGPATDGLRRLLVSFPPGTIRG